MTAYTRERDFDEFAAAKEQFEKLLGELGSPSTRALEHREVESLIGREGNEWLRRLMQGYLDQRAQSEARRDGVVGVDGPARRHGRARSRALATVFGEVRVRRLGYSGAGLNSVFPLDAALNLPHDQYSLGLRRRVASAVAQGSFDEAVKAIEEGTGAQVPKRQTEPLSRAVSVDFDEFYASQPMKTATGLLIMSVDGKGVVMRQQDLRQATHKAAEKSKRKLNTRLSRGEKRHRKRMATVAAVYDVDPYLRTGEQIMGQEEAPTLRPKVRNKRVWASLRQSPAEVVEQLFAEAKRRDPQYERTWLVPVDGQEAQLREVERRSPATERRL
jgi:hypothetical protein